MDRRTHLVQLIDLAIHLQLHRWWLQFPLGCGSGVHGYVIVEDLFNGGLEVIDDLVDLIALVIEG